MIQADLNLNPHVGHRLRLVPLTAEAIEPFGAMIAAPMEIGDRASYTEWLGSPDGTTTPRLHVNRIAVSALPIRIEYLERHPFSAQMFMPIDVARFVVVVAAANEAGGPDLMLARAFIAPGNVGIIYAPDVWHAGATVLDRDGSFVVLMWRNDSEDDERFFQLDAPLHLHI